MALHTIISYDDTDNDHDALALGHVLADAGAELTLAYVRHTTQHERSREELEEHEAQALLERGTRWLDGLEVEQRVVVSASTGEGLKWLAEHEQADLIVFGSDYRTSPGRVSPQRSTQLLLEGGPTAIAIAPANYRANLDREIRTIGILAAPGDDAAIETARDLADSLDAFLSRDEPHVDLLIVGSRPEAAEGQVLLTSQAQHVIEDARFPVLVLARGVALNFRAPIFVS